MAQPCYLSLTQATRVSFAPAQRTQQLDAFCEQKNRIDFDMICENAIVFQQIDVGPSFKRF
jgi:hypothetical protein